MYAHHHSCQQPRGHARGHAHCHLAVEVTDTVTTAMSGSVDNIGADSDSGGYEAHHSKWVAAWWLLLVLVGVVIEKFNFTLDIKM